MILLEMCLIKRPLRAVTAKVERHEEQTVQAF